MGQKQCSLNITLEDVTVGQLRGRLMSLVTTKRQDLLACIRVPRNGLWGLRPDPDFTPGKPDPDGVDDLWLPLEGIWVDPLDAPNQGLRLGTWVEATPGPNGSEAFRLRELPPRRVQLEWQPLAADEYARLDSIDWTYRPAFPNDPDLEAWAVGLFGPSLLGSPIKDPNKGWVAAWTCSCGYEACGSIIMEIRPSPEEGWAILGQIGSGHDYGWDLMPWLQIPLNAPVRPK